MLLFSALVNVNSTDEFPLERGLRQGDPLSPFLFLLVAEGLNVLMQAMVETNVFTGYRIGMQDSIYVHNFHGRKGVRCAKEDLLCNRGNCKGDL
jgi:hypothetical protein